MTRSNRLQRLQKALPRIAKRRGLLEELEALGKVVVLPPSFTEKRRKASSKLDAALEAETRTTTALRQLKAELSLLQVPEQLLHQEEAISDLQQRLGSHLKAARDLTALEPRQQQIEADAHALLCELRPDLTLDAAEGLRITSAQRTRVRYLAGQHQALVDALQRSNRDVQSLEKKLSAAKNELGALGLPRDASELRRAVTDTHRHGDLESARMKASEEFTAEREQTDIELGRLRLWSGTVQELEQLPIPLPETIDGHEGHLHELETSEKTLAARIQAVTAEQRELDRKIRELHAVAAVPTEEELAEARNRREQGWGLVRRAWMEREDVSAEVSAFDAENALPEAYEKSVVRADEVSDRLRREADRVATHAALLSQQAKCAGDLSRLQEEHGDVEKQVDGLVERWAAQWKETGITPLSPKEMRAWTQQQKSLLHHAERFREFTHQVAQLDSLIGASRDRLDRCLQGLGEPASTLDETLGALLNRADSLVGTIESSERKRAGLEGKIAELQGDLAGALEAAAGARGRLDDWLANWAAAVGCIGLTGGALPAEADAVLTALEELFKKLHEAQGIAERVQGIKRDAEQFSAHARAMARLLAPDLADKPVELAAAELGARFSKAKADAARRAELERQVQENENALQQAQASIRMMTQQLNELCAQSGCASPDELEAAEERSSLFQTLKRDVGVVEEQLLDVTGGSTLEQLLEEARTVDVDSLPAEIAEISREVEELEGKRSQLDQTVGREQKELERMDGSAKAAEAGEKAESALAGIRANAERYVRLRLAATILRREVERYRQENQGPLLSRASELFSQLTLSSFSGLRTDFGEQDEPVLSGVRPSGERVGVQGMSDGTRDQLYLSLRLASLEKYLQDSEPIPFVVDDILIRFDDERAEATLRLLAALSRKTQVLFFTHHSRLVEMAERLGGDTLVEVHRLEPTH